MKSGEQIELHDTGSRHSVNACQQHHAVTFLASASSLAFFFLSLGPVSF